MLPKIPDLKCYGIWWVVISKWKSFMCEISFKSQLTTRQSVGNWFLQLTYKLLGNTQYLAEYWIFKAE